jgi:hypothetical protein
MNHALMLDFDYPSFEPHNYALKVSEAEFDKIFGRVKAEGLGLQLLHKEIFSIARTHCFTVRLTAPRGAIFS